MVRDTGFEPVTPTVSRWCSTTELTAHGLVGFEGQPPRRGRRLGGVPAGCKCFFHQVGNFLGPLGEGNAIGKKVRAGSPQMGGEIGGIGREVIGEMKTRKKAKGRCPSPFKTSADANSPRPVGDESVAGERRVTFSLQPFWSSFWQLSWREPFWRLS